MIYAHLVAINSVTFPQKLLFIGLGVTFCEITGISHWTKSKNCNILDLEITNLCFHVN